MFSKDDVGRSVISDYWGIGTVVEFNNYADNSFPIKCTFQEYSVDAYFKITGEYCIEDSDTDKDIRLFEVIEPNVEPTIELISNVPTQVICDGKITAITPEILADAFWNLDSSEQARFYNHLDTIADFMFPFQLQSITDDDGLTLAGRRVMGCIGEYSHWGLVPKLKYDGSIK